MGKLLNVLAAILIIGGAIGAAVVSTNAPSIKVSPHVVSEGQSIYVECRAPHHPDNRLVTWGVDGLALSERTMDGEDAPVTYSHIFPHVPCGVETAYCRVTRASGKVAEVQSTFGVACGE